MVFSLNKSIKYKYLTLDELLINLDRLSRFKLPEESYNRVFTSVILKCLISPKYTKREIEALPPAMISSFVKEIWNKSVENIFGKQKIENIPYKALKILADRTYNNINEKTKTLIKTELKFSEILSSLSYDDCPLNLKFLIKVNEEIKSNHFCFKDLINLRNNYNLKFPVSRLIIVEGITEEILLPVFADKLNCNFDKNGIFILGAGGKSKSPALYCLLKDKLKIPVTILFDADACDIAEILKTNLLNKDKSILIQKGEFEDILSVNLIKRSLNKEYEPATPIVKSELCYSKRMCKNIEDFYRTRHLGEFKKSKLSKIIAKNVKYETDITNDIKILFKLML